jgi:hypothetical protein
MPDLDGGVVAAVRAARERGRPEDVIAGVKNAVADEMRRLDPALKIKKTEYFNHSYIPDLVAIWHEDGKARERPIYIRGSLRAVVAGEDVDALSDQMPLLIGLGDERKKVLDELRGQLPKTTRTLATEVSVTSQIKSPSEDDVADAHLSDLVRTNLVRGGRGLLADVDAKRIGAVEGDEPVEALKAFNKTVRRLFVGDTADRLTRTVGLLQDFFDESPSSETLSQLRDEPLTDVELRVVLPYVLKRAEDVRQPEVWEVLSSMLTLERIESMSLSLMDLDLTPLIRPSVRNLVAGKSAVFLNSDEISEEEKDALPVGWRVRNGRLAADVHRWVLWLGSNGRKLRGRDDGPDARWDELSEPLKHFDLTAIELHGLSRQLAVSNTNAAATREDVESIRETIQDDFHVSSVGVRRKGEPEAPSVKVDFGASTAAGRADIEFHVEAASLLAIKRPFTADDIEALVGEG